MQREQPGRRRPSTSGTSSLTRSTRSGSSTCQTAPEVSVASSRLAERRMVALREANRVRGLRAKLKQDLRADRVRLELVLATRTDYLASAELFDLLVAVPKIGPVKAGRLMTVAGVSPSKTVGGLSERQRARLIELLSR